MGRGAAPDRRLDIGTVAHHLPHCGVCARGFLTLVYLSGSGCSAPLTIWRLSPYLWDK